MAPRETENNAYAKFGVTNKEHYGMLWYFWRGQLSLLYYSHKFVMEIIAGFTDCTLKYVL